MSYINGLRRDTRAGKAGLHHMGSKLQMAESALKSALRRAKNRAKTKKLPFALDMDWAIALAKARNAKTSDHQN